MQSEIQSDGSRITIGVIIGIVMLLVSAGITSVAYFMVGMLVFGCVKSPPDWVYMIVFIGFPIPLLASALITPYLYIKRQRAVWLSVPVAGGIFLSCLIYLIWFLILTQYC